MSEWSHLANASHIDRVLESLKTHPEVWGAARDATVDAAWGAALVAAGEAAADAARNAAWDAASEATARSAARNAAVGAAVDAILALIAWDDSDQFLKLSSDKLEVWARISDDPRAILMLPAVCVFERIKELETL